jgi:hypothetical protein
MDTIHWQGTLSNIRLVPRVHERGLSHIPDLVGSVPLLQEISDVKPGVLSHEGNHTINVRLESTQLERREYQYLPTL